MKIDLKIPLLLMATIVAGCATNSPIGDSELPYSPPRQPQVGDILHTATGHFINRSQFYDGLAYYPLIYIGEVHDNPASHRLEVEILDAMQQRNQGRVSLGMEMFNHEQQPALDRWVAGELSEKEFLRESRWYENWGSDFSLYRELLEYCRDNNVPVIGLNTTKSLGRKVSMTALEKLEPEVRQKLPEMDFDDPYHRMMIQNIFGAHGAGAKLLESFTRRQTLWDETMAASITDYQRSHPEQQMVVVAGGWHVSYGFGIPRRVHRRNALPYVTVGGFNLVVPEEKRDQLMDVDMPTFPMRSVDYLVYQEYEIFEPGGVKLGVGLDDSGESAGLLVTQVEPESAAARAGINKGDRLLRFDDQSLEDNFDLIYAVKASREGDRVIIKLQRDGAEMTVEVQF